MLPDPGSSQPLADAPGSRAGPKPTPRGCGADMSKITKGGMAYGLISLNPKPESIHIYRGHL